VESPVRTLSCEEPIDGSVSHLHCAGDLPYPFRASDLIGIPVLDVPPCERGHDHMDDSQKDQQLPIGLSSGHHQSTISRIQRRESGEAAGIHLCVLMKPVWRDRVRKPLNISKDINRERTG
jgi:hypothetical protein